MARITICDTKVTHFQSATMELQTEIAQLCDDMRKLASQMANAVSDSAESYIRALSRKT